MTAQLAENGPAAGVALFRRPVAFGLACLVTGAGLLAVPARAQAADGVDSWLNVGCTIHPDVAQVGSQEPDGVAFDGERHDVTASPETHTITASSVSVYPADTSRTGEDCGAEGEYRDQLTVGAGSSGLSAGDTVQVQVTVRLEAQQAETWDDDGFFQVRADYDAMAALVDLDACEPGSEGGTFCDQAFGFGELHEHYVSGGPADAWNPAGYVDAVAERSFWFRTNGGSDVSDDIDEQRRLCMAWPCSPVENALHPDGQEAHVLTGSATLVVGHHYSLKSELRLFTQAYDNVDVRGAVTGDLSVLLAAATGFEGVELAWASAGSPPGEDTLAPDVVASVSPPAVEGWHTAAPTIAFSATDAGSGVASITYSSTGAGTTPETVVDGDAAVLAVATDGVTEVTYRATDLAGNTSDPQTLTVRLDTVAPTLSVPADLTAVATSAEGAPVTWTVTGSDNLGVPTTTCDRASGSTFPVGTTTVTCTARDAAGHATSGTFLVTVTAPPPTLDPMDQLEQTLASTPLTYVVRVVLTTAYRLADAQFDAGNVRGACRTLRAMQIAVFGAVAIWQMSQATATTVNAAIHEVIVARC